MKAGGSITARAIRSGRADFKMHALSVFSLAVAFVCLASAVLVVENLEALRSRWSRVGRASVYLREGDHAREAQELREALNRTPGVTKVTLVTPEDARRELVEGSGDAALAALPPVAFAASLEVDFAPEMADSDVTSVAQRLRGFPAVEAVETYAKWSERLGVLLKAGVVASLLLAVVVLAAVVSVVGSTMRMALERRRREVEVLKLVGATDGYVRAPFVLEGAAEGGFGATFALVLLGVLYAIVHSFGGDSVAPLFGIAPSFLSPLAMLGLVSLGAGLGAASAAATLRKLSAV